MEPIGSGIVEIASIGNRSSAFSIGDKTDG
jgi:hypothetical protein